MEEQGELLNEIRKKDADAELVTNDQGQLCVSTVAPVLQVEAPVVPEFADEDFETGPGEENVEMWSIRAMYCMHAIICMFATIFVGVSLLVQNMRLDMLCFSGVAWLCLYGCMLFVPSREWRLGATLAWGLFFSVWLGYLSVWLDMKSTLLWAVSSFCGAVTILISSLYEKRQLDKKRAYVLSCIIQGLVCLVGYQELTWMTPVFFFLTNCPHPLLGEKYASPEDAVVVFYTWPLLKIKNLCT